MKITRAIREAYDAMDFDGELVHTERWQATDISQKPDAQMVELLHYQLKVDMEGSLYHEDYAHAIEPNLPWADDHFEERICGYPINPGIEWKNWPWGKSAEGHREDGMFNHNYMERYWPKFASLNHVPIETKDEWFSQYGGPRPSWGTTVGIRSPYGDLDDLIRLLAEEPTTRQAYFPVWFPEDTGTAHRGRKPCTLGYHFIMRKGRLDIRYDIRSCDMYRHFRDDIYLTIRLGLYILERCKDINPEVWKGVVPGTFVMNITSLHMFINDYILLFKHRPE